MRTSKLSLAAFATLVATTSVAAAEAPDAPEALIHDTTTSVEIALTPETVLCSSADYGALFLKVGIPALAGLTLLDHQNAGAGAPCVAAGMCEPGNQPEDILDPADTTETVAIRVRASRMELPDAGGETCSTYLIERVDVAIRGVEFTHARQAPLGTRAIADCTTLVAPVDEPTPAGVPADGPDDTLEAASTGGCDAGGEGGAAGGAAFALAIGGVLGLLRWRRELARPAH